jgi:hypothetical protein
MSLAVIVAVDGGVAMSADSRSVVLRDPDETADPRPVTWDGSYNLVLLWDSVGVARCGDDHITGVPVEARLAALETSRPPPDTVAQAAGAVLEHLTALSPDADVELCVAAYQGGMPFLFEVHTRTRRVTRVTTDAQGNAQRAVYFLLGRGGVEAEIVRALMGACRPVLKGMPLHDAVDLSRHLVRTVIDQTRFGEPPAVAGGPIDTLVLTPEGARWFARKAV